MRKTCTLLAFMALSMAIGIVKANAQVVDVCAGNDTVELHLGNFHYGLVQWQVSDDNETWFDIDGAIDTVYRFLPEHPRYYRAEVHFPACMENNYYSQVSYVQMPPKANAGPNMSIPAGTVARLCASSFKGAEGEWHIIEGENGLIEDPTNSKSCFIGEEGEYKLTWTVTNSCGSNTDTVTVKCVQMVYQSDIVYVDETDAILSDSTQLMNGEYVIVFSDPVPDIQVGSVLLGYRMPSFLRKVVSFERNGDLYIMQTEQGQLTDIIFSGALFMDPIGDAEGGKKSSMKFIDRYPTRREMLDNPFLMRDGNTYMIRGLIPDVAQRSDDWAVTTEIEDGVLTLGLMLNLGLLNDNLEGLIYEETVSLEPNMRANIEIENWHLKECYFGYYDAVYSHTVSLSIDKELSAVELGASGKINPTPIIFPFLMGGLPVVFSADFPVSIMASASINGLNLSFTSSTTFTDAIEYDPETHWFNRIWDSHEPVSIPGTFDITGTLGVKFQAGMNFSILIAGVVGPYAEWRGTINPSICISAFPPYHASADLNLGLDMDLGLRLHLFKDLLENDVCFNFPIYERKEHAPSSIKKYLGDNQVYSFGNYLSTPITVDVEGWFGTKLPLAKIHFEPETGGEVTESVVSTDIYGKASTLWKPNNPFGRDKLRVKAYDCHGDLIAGTPVVFHAFSSATDPCINSNLAVEAYHVQEDRIIPQVSGGRAPYLYSTDGESFSIIQPNIQTEPGHNYTFYVQDADGCEAMTTYNEPFYDCENSSLMLSVTTSGNVITATGFFGLEPYWYSIDGINYQPTGLFGVQLDGEYTVFVRDALGCVDTKHVTVSREGNLYVWISEINGHSGTAEVMASSGSLAERGVCWSTHHAPTVEDLHASYGNNTGPFPFTINGLDPETTYYVRAYALDHSGTSYSEERCINPGNGIYLPDVAATGVTSITQTSAVGSGNVTYDGGAEVAERGICWGTSHDPDISGNHIVCGSGVGAFTVYITDLIAGTQYYARAYATNSEGTAYGEEVEFFTQQNGGGGGGNVNHDYVDLGLPSGTLWATCNIGANAPEEYGDYFAWGETQPKDNYNWSTYLYCKGSNTTFTKYCNNSYYGYNGYTDDLTTLLPEDDAATFQWGGHWCMPTKAQWVELHQYTSKVFTTQNGVRGELFTASNGNSLFLPYANSGRYWSSSLYSSPNEAWDYYFYSGGCGVGNFGTFRCKGKPVRPVRSSQYIGDLPQVVTVEVADYTSSIATFGGVVISDGGLSITRCGVCWSTSHNPELSDNHCDVEAGAGVFTVIVAGLNQGTSYFVRAYATNDLGTVYGNEVSFATSTDAETPEGAINGLFSVGEGQQVYFSRGNLQYHVLSGSWWFAENQYEFIGDDNINISPSYQGKIDLFGWGTSGYDHGAVYYQPWSSNWDLGGYHAYNCDSCNLYDYSGCADWGYNSISNGGAILNSWRTPTKEEWYYLLFTRNTSSDIRYVKGKVNGVNGLILLPDNWNSSYYSLSGINQVDSNFDSNVLNEAQWDLLQQYGVVFLPAAGSRSETFVPPVQGVGTNGVYWSSSNGGPYTAYMTCFRDGYLMPNGHSNYWGDEVSCTSIGHSVRLVQDVGSNPPQGYVPWGFSWEGVQYITTESVNYKGIVTYGSCPMLSKGACWSTTPNPTIADQFVEGDFNSFDEMVHGSIYGLTSNTTYHLRVFVTDSIQTYYSEDVVFTTLPNGGSTHNYVDLGLPSGTLWATCNVGANAPEEYGDYFAWGETQPKDFYDWDTYQYCMGSGNTLTKYCSHFIFGYNGFTDNLTTLLPEDDAATANWGDGWCMPTMEEWQELLDNTTSAWTTLNGVNGCLFTAQNGNSLFLPAAGYRQGSELHGEGGYCWSRSLNTSSPDNAWNLGFHSDGCFMPICSRLNGFSVRPVRSNSNPIGDIPQGAINGLFSIGEGQQVYFSQGNLQYQASTNTWKFAENQWDYIGEDNNNISPTYDGWIDLFGWGTSGYNHGAVCFQPWSTSQNPHDYEAYGNWEYNLFDQTGMADWGYNAISNGGNTENRGWRTLNREEWIYVFDGRNTDSGVRFAKATVAGIKGVVLLPDNWHSSIFALNNVNQKEIGYQTNTISISEWSILEANGAVFFPVTGARDGSELMDESEIGPFGAYWGSSLDVSGIPRSLLFRDDTLESDSDPERSYGIAVRLVYGAGSGRGNGGEGRNK